VVVVELGAFYKIQPPMASFKRSMPQRRNIRKYARGLYTAASTGYRIARSYSGTQTKRLDYKPAPITGENDSRRTYTRRPMPRRRKRAWVKFTKKTNAANLKHIGSNFFILTRQDLMASAVNKQATSDIHTCLGLFGSSYCRDIQAIAARVEARESPATSARHLKFVITGWMAETQIHNESGETAYVDMYYWKCKKKVPRVVNEVPDVSPNIVFEQGLADLATNAPLGGSSLNRFDYGVTPFQSPFWSQNITVTRKVRVKLSAGGVTQVETRSGRNYHRFWGHDEDYAMDTCTEGIYMIAYGIPTALAPTAQAISLRLSTNINYTYKVLEGNVMTGATNAP